MTSINNYKFEGLSVAIIDDHELVLEGFRSFLVRHSITDVEAFSKAQPLLDRIASHPFSVYIVDVELSDIEITELIDRIRDLQPEAKIIINTMHEEMWVVNKMTEKKVDGVMYKSGGLDQLLEAIAAVTSGHQYFCKKFQRSQRNLQVQNQTISDRELEVLIYIAKGYSTKEIATSLFISENTVENHRKSLFRKLQAHNMADLIIKAIANGYINPEEIANNL
ncbi:MAG: response regulator transcription factor [Prevotella sp.]|nr:response regulator transcription factor [Prevotella sp.]